MNRTRLIRLLKNNGWWYIRSGANHDIYTDGTAIEPIPRHSEINENLARDIIRKHKLKRKKGPKP